MAPIGSPSSPAPASLSPIVIGWRPLAARNVFETAYFTALPAGMALLWGAEFGFAMPLSLGAGAALGGVPAVAMVLTQPHCVLGPEGLTVVRPWGRRRVTVPASAIAGVGILDAAGRPRLAVWCDGTAVTGRRFPERLRPDPDIAVIPLCEPGWMNEARVERVRRLVLAAELGEWWTGGDDGRLALSPADVQRSALFTATGLRLVRNAYQHAGIEVATQGDRAQGTCLRSPEGRPLLHITRWVEGARPVEYRVRWPDGTAVGSVVATSPRWRLCDPEERVLATARRTRNRGRHPRGALVVRDPGTAVVASVWPARSGQRAGLRLQAEPAPALRALLIALLSVVV
ncbi:hypothetical protein [Actinomadura rugatobispora]|uniref:Uncharacterized protein n=1 Tax=Actinomadura rugatobispora TaxID=1994 RepID=A0ABW1ABW2_9ACTN